MPLPAEGDMIDIIIGHYNYWVVILLMMAGFYTVINRGNLIKKIAGLNIFQTSVFLLYISIGYVNEGTTPIVAEGFTKYANPLPHVLILTAIVVGVSTIALGLALIIRIKEAYGTIEEDEIHDQDMSL
jgi:multicomponent Na+:H+ antiporter subunit C